MDDRQSKSGGLTRSSLSTTKEVAALQNVWDRLRLNGSRGLITFRLDRIHNGLTEPEISKTQRKLQAGRRKRTKGTIDRERETESKQAKRAMSQRFKRHRHPSANAGHVLKYVASQQNRFAMERHPSRDRSSCRWSGMRPRNQEPASQEFTVDARLETQTAKSLFQRIARGVQDEMCRTQIASTIKPIAP